MIDWLVSLDWRLESMFALRTLLAVFLGTVVGWERHLHGRDAGIRTFGAVALGACIFSLVSAHIPGADPSRMAANVVTGMGFLGGAVIFRAGRHTRGLTAGPESVRPFAVCEGSMFVVVGTALRLLARPGEEPPGRGCSQRHPSAPARRRSETTPEPALPT